jgi:hypothetical protein
MMRVSSVRSVPAVLLLACAVASCNKAGTNSLVHPALLATETNQDRLLGQVVVTNLDRTLATADALRAEGILPFGGAELRQMITARLGLSSDLFDLVDTSQPINLAMVDPMPAATPGPDGKSAPPLIAGAVTLRSVAAAATALGNLGAPAETRKDAQRFALRDGSSVWIAHGGGPLERRVLFSETFAGLSEAGAHAHAAREDPGDDVAATFFPPAFQRRDAGRAGGGLKARAIDAYEDERRDRGQAVPPAEKASVEAAVDYLVQPLSQTDRLRVALGLSSQGGFGLRVRAVPHEKSQFAQRLSTRAPYDLAGAAAGGAAPPVGLLATGVWPTWPALAQTMLDRQAAAKVPGADAVAARLRALLPLLSGAVLAASRAQGEQLALDWSFGLAAGAKPQAASTALQALVTEPALPVLLQQVWGRYPPRIESARKGNRLEVTFTFPPGDRPAPARAFSGSDTMTFVVEETAGRLLVGTEPGADERLRLLASSGAGAAPPSLAGALNETRGQEGLLYFEVAGLARPIVKAALPDRQRRFVDMLLNLPGLSGLSLPLWLSLDGGQQLALDVRVPLTTLRNASMLMSMLSGAGAGLPQ